MRKITDTVTKWITFIMLLSNRETLFPYKGKDFKLFRHFSQKYRFRLIFPWILLINNTNLRSSHRRCSVKKGVLRNFAKFTEKHLCQSPFFNEVAGRACDFIKKGLWHRCFPVNFAKFLRTPGWLLLPSEKSWKYSKGSIWF